MFHNYEISLIVYLLCLHLSITRQQEYTVSLLRQILHCLTLHFCGITVISILLKTHNQDIPLNIIEVDKIIRRVCLS